MSSPAPDLTFYYSTLERVNALVYDNNVARSNVRTFPLYAERELINKIGNIYTTGLEFKKNGTDDIDVLLVQRVFSFSFGTFVSQGSTNDQFIIIPVGTAAKPDTIGLSTITSGNGDFFGSTGSVVIINDKTPIVQVLVYFSKT